MLFRPSLRLLLLMIACLLVPGAIATAADTHEGKVVSVQESSGNSDGKLVMTDKDGKGEHTHPIPSQTKITRDDKSAKLGELKKGDWVKVTTENGKVVELASGNARAGGSDVEDILANLKLTADQQDKIKKICKDSESEREATWKAFGIRYREAVAIEASMLAAIEDKLSDAQRKNLREHRQRHHHRGNQAQRDGGNKGAVVEEITIIGVTLSPEQEDAAETLRDRYSDRLQDLNGMIEDLHARLVGLETERLLEIEGVLTKDQREQLRKEHQKVTKAAKLTSGPSSTVK